MMHDALCSLHQPNFGTPKCWVSTKRYGLAGEKFKPLKPLPDAHFQNNPQLCTTAHNGITYKHFRNTFQDALTMKMSDCTLYRIVIWANFGAFPTLSFHVFQNSNFCVDLSNNVYVLPFP